MKERLDAVGGKKASKGRHENDKIAKTAALAMPRSLKKDESPEVC